MDASDVFFFSATLAVLFLALDPFGFFRASQAARPVNMKRLENCSCFWCSK